MLSVASGPIETLVAHDERGAERECIAAVWEGWGSLRRTSAIEQAPPHRNYVLFRGVLAEMATLDVAEPRSLDQITPSLLWAADTSWCVATEVDFDSTLVGGPRSLVDALLANAHLEAFAVEPADSLAWDGDRVNGPVSSR